MHDLLVSNQDRRPTEEEFGFKARLLGLNNFKISRLNSTRLTFKDVRGYNYTGEGLTAVRPKLFHLEADDFDNFGLNAWNFTSLFILESKIVNADCMIDFTKSDGGYRMENFTLHNNGEDGIGAESIIKI